MTDKTFPAESQHSDSHFSSETAVSPALPDAEAAALASESTGVPSHNAPPHDGDTASGSHESAHGEHPQAHEASSAKEAPETPVSGDDHTASSEASSQEQHSEEGSAHSATLEEPQAEEPEPGSLEDFAARAKRNRLSADEEAEAGRLFKEALLGGRAEVARAVAAAPQLPWVVTVQGTSGAWPEMKPSFRAQFLAGLARMQGEAAARVRLSLARGLFKVDQAAGLKLILLTLKVLRDKQTGLLAGKGASLFANVLIGRGKAWVLQLPLQELKPAEIDLLVFGALHGAFHQPQAPLTQLSILKWAAAAERLGKLSEALEQMILKGISRWSSKWQAALRREVSPLPDNWVELLKSPAPKHARESADPAESGDESAEDSPAEESQRPKAELDAHEKDQDDDPDDEEEDDDESDEAEDDNTQGSQDKGRKQRPVYVSKTVTNGPNGGAPGNQRRGAAQHFNLQETLRQVESYVSGLRNELQSAQKQLRQREDDSRRARRPERVLPPPNPGELSIDELIRLNQQLESRNAELQTRIDELTVDSETRAASRGLITDAPPPDPNTELRILLGYKLKEDREDFLALEQETRDLVVQQHYRTVLHHVFEVLHAEGIQFPPSEEPQKQ